MKGDDIANQHQENSSKGFRYKLSLETLALVIAGLLAWLTYNTLTEIEEQTKIANQNTFFTQRAYLKIGEIKEMEMIGFGIAGVRREVDIALVNFGRVPCNKIFIYLSYVVADSGHYEITQKPDSSYDNHIIPPNESSKYSVGAILPELSLSLSSKIKRGEVIPAIVGKIVYDTGFDSFDSLSVCLSYLSKPKKWIQCGVGASIQLTNKKNQN